MIWLQWRPSSRSDVTSWPLLRQFVPLTCVLVLILSLLYIGESGIIFTIAVSVLTITILLISLLIHGVRKMKARLVNIYIIFRITVFFIYTVLVFILIILALVAVAGWMKWMTALGIVNIFLFSSFLYVYSAGFSVLQYNIMLADQTEGETIKVETFRLADSLWISIALYIHIYTIYSSIYSSKIFQPNMRTFLLKPNMFITSFTSFTSFFLSTRHSHIQVH